MTQVLSLLRREGPIQVSDRRVSMLHADGQVLPQDDLRNKAIVWFDRMSVGYSGLASIDGETPAQGTDWWIANTLQPFTSVGDGVMGLKTACDAAFSRPRQRGRALAVVLMGWSEYEHEPRFRPEVAVVSNFLGDAFETWVGRDCLAIQHQPLAVQPEFAVAAFGMDPNVRRLLHVVGEPLTNAELSTSLRGVRRAADRTEGPLAELRLLATRIRLTADRCATVGRSLMATHLPPPVAGRVEYKLIMGEPTPDAPSCLYLPENADEPIEYTANFVAGLVSGGGQVVHGGPPPHGHSHAPPRFPPGHLP